MTTRPKGVGEPSTQPTDTPEALVGRVLDGRFRLDRVMSVGGMGIILEAMQLNVQRRVAVKLLKPTLSNDTDLLTRFNHEIEVIGRLAHPNVVSLVDGGRAPSGLVYLVMEFVEGDTLREMLKQCRLSLPEILGVCVQVCNALIEAHAAGVIHRDLKFDNIMIRRLEDGRLHVTVLDFGVAKLLTRPDGVTRTGEVPGTPGIIAPELIDDGTPSPQSDLYSLGVLMFTALAGDAPYHGDNELELMRAHKIEKIPNLKKILGDRVPEEVVDLVIELMHKQPKRRPSTATAVRDRIENIIAGLHERLPDPSRYVPPRGEGFEPLVESDGARESAARSEGFLDEKSEDEPDAVGAPPAVAPASIVGLLIAILTILVLVIIYLVYQNFVLRAAG